jgi:hypothetical protein
VEQYGGVLAATEEEHRAFRLRGHLADDENGERLEQVEMAERVLDRPDQGCHRGSRTAVD